MKLFRYEGKEHLRTHHLYVCPQDSKELKRHLAFRNYLRKHPNTVKEYGKIKKEAAKLYPNDIEKYCMYKSQIIEKFIRNESIKMKKSYKVYCLVGFVLCRYVCNHLY